MCWITRPVWSSFWNTGGDDYIKKPYSLTTLLAKVKAALRRQENPGFHPCELKNPGPIVLDYNYHQVTVEEEPKKLKEMEFKLLSFLCYFRMCFLFDMPGQ